jgi:hypothetical protein
MAHFAQLDENNTVIQVVVVNNDDIGNLQFPESEPIGIAYLHNLFGPEGIWKQTSFSGSFRQRLAAQGCPYDLDHDYFIHAQPYPSWIINEEDGSWINPVPKPDAPDGYDAVWVEPRLNWFFVVKRDRP